MPSKDDAISASKAQEKKAPWSSKAPGRDFINLERHVIALTAHGMLGTHDAPEIALVRYIDRYAPDRSSVHVQALSLSFDLR
jgi:hypothetical protein